MKLCECGCGREVSIATKTDRRYGLVKGQPAHFLPGHHGKVQHCTTSPPAYPLMTVDYLDRLRDMPDDDAAHVCDDRVRQIEQMTRCSFVELGVICLEVQRRELWARLTHPTSGVYYHSWEDWAMSAMGVSRTSAFTAKKVVEQLAHVDLMELVDIPRRNLLRLASLSTAVQRDPRILESAKNDSEDGFLAKVRELYPDQHVEPKRKLLAEPTDSAAAAMEECFEAVKWVYDVTTREDVMENLTAYFMDGTCEREGYDNRTNREAYQMVKEARA